MILTANAIALERLLVRRRELSGELLNADMYDRWGPKDGAMHADAETWRVEHTRVTGELAAMTADLAARDRKSIVAWARAHVALLEQFVAAKEADEAQSTACFVANQEIDEWRKVERGELNFVNENCYYVHISPAHHAEYFGPAVYDGGQFSPG